MAKKFVITVEQVTGYCACGYQKGDTIVCEGLNTPERPFCGGAYAILFPMQNALHAGARFDFEKNPYSKTKLTCPDNGYVTFSIALDPEEQR